jgi:hypothetical protein
MGHINSKRASYYIIKLPLAISGGLLSWTRSVMRFHWPLTKLNEDLSMLIPKSSLQSIPLSLQRPFGDGMYAYTVPGVSQETVCQSDVLVSYRPSPAPFVLHINLVLKQSEPFGCFPPSQPLTTGPPLKPGSFPPWTQSKPPSKATSYVTIILWNALPSLVFHSVYNCAPLASEEKLPCG